MDLKNKKIAVLGLGVEGKSTVNFLLSKGIEPVILDQKISKNYLKNLQNSDVIFRTPGISYFTPELQTAVKKGVTVTSQTKYFLQNTKAKTIGVTGTKGKGTTATWIYEMLKASGKKAYLAGNIGVPFLDILPKAKKGEFVVMELSSFQLEDLDKSPDVSIILNITEDHLDYHADLKAYHSAKYNLAKYASAKQWLVLNQDYPTSKKAGNKTAARKFYISTKKQLKTSHTCYLLNDRIVLQNGKQNIPIGSVADIKLRGRHNWENALAAAAAAHLAGASIAGIRKALKSFKGLEHRLEPAGSKKGVKYFNDSFSTNPQPTIAAINSFDEPIVLIAGGHDKGLNYEILAAEIAEKNVKAVILLGKAGEKIKKGLKKVKYSGKILAGEKAMKKIVRQAANLAEAGDVVLLSPAAASFDMFDNYKQRGEEFKRAVSGL